MKPKSPVWRQTLQLTGCGPGKELKGLEHMLCTQEVWAQSRAPPVPLSTAGVALSLPATSVPKLAEPRWGSTLSSQNAQGPAPPVARPQCSGLFTAL